MEPQHFVHIGYPKTGSSFLKSVLVHHPQVICNGKFGFFNVKEQFDKGTEWYFEHFSPENNGGNFNFREDHLSPFQGIDDERLDELRSTTDVKATVDSTEALSTGFTVETVEDWHSKHRLPDDRAKNVVGDYNQKKIIERIHQTTPDAKIIVVIREQLSWHRSFYAETVRGRVDRDTGGRRWSFSDYLNSEFPGQYNIKAAKYHDVVRQYQDCFGKENVKLLFFEEFKRNKINFLNNLYTFLGVESFLPDDTEKKVNRRLQNVNLQLVNFLDRATGGNAGKVRKLLPESLKSQLLTFFETIVPNQTADVVTESDKSRLRNLYRENNQQLADLVGQEKLKQLDYVL